MTTDHPLADPDPNVEGLADGATWLLDLVAAVDHLRRGYRPNLTVWDALTEAIDWYADNGRAIGEAGDALGDALARIAQPTGTPAAARIQAALRRWVTTMADRYNDGHHWPHPVSRRDFPPPMIDH